MPAQLETMAEEHQDDGRLVSLPEVRALLEAAERERGELSYEQKLALEHARAFAVKLEAERSHDLVGRLVKLSPKVTPAYAVKIADVLPTHADDVRTIFAKERFQLDADEISKILETVQQYL
jgi:DNA-directed RNA polymerase subunit F